EDGIRYRNVTGVQTCALPISKVQSLSINKILDNKDLIVNAQTGSGKTLSYLLPMFEKIDSTKRETQVLILAPTHELVMQITDQRSEERRVGKKSSKNMREQR